MTHDDPLPAAPSDIGAWLDLMYPDLEHELHATRRVLERFPDGRADWRPHDRSRTIAELATHVAELPERGVVLVESDELDLASRTPGPVRRSAAELLSTFDGSAARLRRALASTDLASLRRPWTLRHGPKVLLAMPKLVLLREMLLSHLVHHRAQLGVYYRLLGVAVPGTYGPSADEPLPPPGVSRP